MHQPRSSSIVGCRSMRQYGSFASTTRWDIRDKIMHRVIGPSCPQLIRGAFRRVLTTALAISSVRPMGREVHSHPDPSPYSRELWGMHLVRSPDGKGAVGHAPRPFARWEGRSIRTQILHLIAGSCGACTSSVRPMGREVHSHPDPSPYSRELWGMHLVRSPDGKGGPFAPDPSPYSRELWGMHLVRSPDGKGGPFAPRSFTVGHGASLHSRCFVHLWNGCHDEYTLFTEPMSTVFNEAGPSGINHPLASAMAADRPCDDVSAADYGSARAAPCAHITCRKNIARDGEYLTARYQRARLSGWCVHIPPAVSRGFPPSSGERSPLASHRGEPGSIPGRATPGFSRVGIVPDDAARRRVFSEISRFPRPCISALLHSQVLLPSSALKTSLLRAAQISQLNPGPGSLSDGDHGGKT
ncbi:hypothetical protein PR048_006976 [Dryococelus australis]|uniref:Uncharacterized protein n=1 Tax=Dryococelus australis TaxID=614101 RepID=A0ABQ9ICF3_9NEOP|nr:hypothetical protein PR048_006976 [Dryococelus australis]